MQHRREKTDMQYEIRRILDALPGLVWSALPDGQLDFLNQQWCEYTGLNLQEACGSGWQAAIHSEDLPELIERWQSILASGESGQMEARLRRYDGDYRWFRFSVRPLLNAAGAIVQWYGMSTDIDDSIRAEGLAERNLNQVIETQRDHNIEILQAQQDLLDLAQKSARAMAFDWHIQREVNVWSPEQEALYGLPPGSFNGTYQSWKKLIYAPDWPVLHKAIKHAHQTGEVAVEFRVMWPDGSLHWLATNGQMFFDDQGKPFRMVGFTSDVTPRKLAEEELRRSEEFLAQAQHLSSTGSFCWRVETGEITWSEQAYHIFGLDRAVPMTLELIRTRVHPEDIPLFNEVIERVHAIGGDFEFEHRLTLPDHSIKHLHVIAHGRLDQDGALEYIGAVQDVTERRLSEEALGKLRSELAHVSRVATLGALTASIAHEVNQPLSGIITNASTCLRMLAADSPNIDGARETARRTIRDGHRAADVITRLRALFSKTGAATEPVDLNEATREVITLSQGELRKSRVVLGEELAANLPPVRGDRVQLQQVILNLLLNASDAMSAVEDRPRQLLIRTELEEGEQRVRLRVVDAGVGFEPQDLERLFDAFYSTKSGGMGIGLSVSRSIIESHQGRLWATPNDGPGATFSFSLPHASAFEQVASGATALTDAERAAEGS